MTPAAVEDEVRRPARSATPSSRRWWGRPPTTCPACPGVGPGLRRQVDQPVRRPRQRHHPRRRDHRQEGRGAARAPRRRDPQPPAQRAGPRPRPRARARPTWRGQPWDRQAVHTLFDGLEFRVLRDRLLETLRVRGGARSTTPASTLDAAPARRRARSPAGWPTHARRRRAGRRPRPGPLAGRHRRRLTGWRFADRGRRGRLGRRRRARRPTTTRRWPPGSPTRRSRRCCTTPRARCSRSPRAGWPLAGLDRDTALSAYLARPDQRSYDLADLTVRYLKRELQAGARPTTGS